jgi:phosphate transport system permease protein
MNRKSFNWIELREFLMKIVFAFAALTAVIAVVTICFFLFSRGVPTVFEVGILNFLGGREWQPTWAEPLYGILPMILGSIYVTVGAILIGVPIGILVAAYLAKMCPKPLYRVLKPMVNLLAGVPSVVFGFFGMVIIAPLIRDTFNISDGNTMLAASILLGIMILPTVIAITEASLRAVPNEYYEGAVALGSSHERAIFRVILPAAKSGVMAAVVLGIGRAIGETMAVRMVAGNQTLIRLPWEFTQGVRTLTTNVVMEMGYADETHQSALIATGVVLFLFILVVNTAFTAITKGNEDKKVQKVKKGPPAGVIASGIVGAILGMVIVPFIGFMPDVSDKQLAIDTFIVGGVEIDGKTVDAEINDRGVITGATVNGESIGGRIEAIVIDGQRIERNDIPEHTSEALGGIIRNGEVRNVRFSGSIIDAILGTIFGAFLVSFAGKYLTDRILKYLTWTASFVTIAVMSFIIGYILIRGIPHLTPALFEWQFTSNNQSMMPALINTAAMVIATLLVSVPFGVFSAIYLVEYSKRGSKFVKIVRMMTETLAGIPSIVYGLFGFIFFVQVMGWGFSLIAGAFTLAIMVLPTIMRTTEEALKSVSDTYREGSFGLGAGRLRTVFRIVLPSAMPGILAGIILSIGRIVGETAALMFTASTVARVLGSPFDSTRTLAVHMYMLSNEGVYREQAFATAVILLLLVISINTVSSMIAKKVTKA